MTDNSDISNIRTYLREHEKKLYSLEHHINRMTRQFGRREKVLLTEIAKLHQELRQQTTKFQEKILYFTNNNVDEDYGQYSTLEQNPYELTPVIEEEQAEPDCDQGVYVSRILTDCPETTNALQPYDRILKVNGRDVSQSCHQEAVEAFKVAQEPIVVQVCRRLKKSRHENTNLPISSRQSDMSLTTASTQTDPLSEDEDELLNIGETTSLLGRKETLNCPMASSAKRGAVEAPPVAADPTTMAQLELVADGFIDDTDFDEDCQRQLYDVEYEEVTLRRSLDGEKLGLTLCYGSGDNIDTDIFVGEIEPESVADKDGRIKAGDQILQINGVDVHTRNRAIELFGKENVDITLLLARSSNGESLRDVVQAAAPLEETIDEERSSTTMQDQIFEEDDGVLTDGTRGSAGSAHEKDSGISRTTDSEPDYLPPPINTSPSKYSQASSGGSNSVGRSAQSNGSGKEISTPEIQQQQHALSLNSLANFVDSSSGDIVAAQTAKRSDSESSLERELHNLHREMEFIQIECDRLIEQHAKAERQVRQQMDQANKLVATMDEFQKQQKLLVTSNQQPTTATMFGKYPVNDPISERSSRAANDETSSAYNTGNESCRSTPLNSGKNNNSNCHASTTIYETNLHTILPPAIRCRKYLQMTPTTTMTVLDDQNEYETIGDEEEGKRDSAVFTLPTRSSSNKQQQEAVRNVAKVSPRQFHHHDGPLNSKSSKVKDYGNLSNTTTMTTSAELSGILRQCCNNVSNFEHQQQRQNASFALGDVMYTNPENLEQTILLQQRLLRQAMIQQARQLKAQQAFGKGPVPFYPNACSPNNEEVKVEWKIKRRSDGTRYVTRRPVRNKMLKERAQQLSNERVGVSTDDDAMSELKIGRYWTKDERKKHVERQKERKKRQEELIRRQNEKLQQPNDQPILQMSQRKMMRRQGQQLFDKFTTVQEFLSHGTRTAAGKRAFGLLSVTTV